MVILLKACKPDNFELHKALKLSFTDNQGLCLNFVDYESFLESNSPDILALCDTNHNDSIDSGNFSVRGYLLLIQKDSSTYMHVNNGLEQKGFLIVDNVFLPQTLLYVQTYN